ncbi:ABC transporter permease subunit [Mycoplasma sp. 332]|uniref:ABC transporter permease subunit n=1 Tax=Mycoplasma sp. 332 TaxID=3458236 RepID=UPI0040356718
MHNNLFNFAREKKSNSNPYVIHTNSAKQYWKRFFANKFNLICFICFAILILALLIATFLIKNSPTHSINENTTLVNDLPSNISQKITKNFNRGVELDFIRNIAKLEAKSAASEHRNLIFWIEFDSARDIGGEQTIYTDIVTLTYNPYNLIKAVNLLQLSKDMPIEIPNGLFLGTNNQGIDIYARTITSIWSTILIILAAIIINIFIGFNFAVIINIYKQNIIVRFIDRIINSISVIPEIIWVFLLSIFIGTSLYGLFISLSIICWISYFKFAKEEINSLLTQEFIVASRAVGASNWRIAYNHIFKRIFANFLIILVERFSINILIASSLAFLDFINDSNSINIGFILKEAISLVSNNPGYLLTTSIFIIAFSINLKLLSSSLANTFNPKTK